MTNIGQTLLASINTAIVIVVSFIPKFIAGFIILLVGIILASILKQAVISLLGVIKVESMLSRYGVPEGKDELNWTNIIAEIVRWFIIIIFLIPTADIWGLPRIGTVLNEFLMYLPNVLVAAIIAVVGFTFARLAYEVVFASTKGFTKETARMIANVTRWAINIFVVLAVLNQLGVATDLIRILFTGFVAMLALAGGIAFGLGGQDAAKDMVTQIKKRIR